MPTAPLQVSHLSGLQPPLSQTCQCYRPHQPTDLPKPTSQQALRLIQVTITFHLAVRCHMCHKMCHILCHMCNTLCRLCLTMCHLCHTCQLDVTFCIPCVGR